MESVAGGNMLLSKLYLSEIGRQEYLSKFIHGPFVLYFPVKMNVHLNRYAFSSARRDLFYLFIIHMIPPFRDIFQ